MIPTLITLAMDADEAMEKVRPGWIPLIIVMLLGAFIAFLFFSLRKQLGKIDIPEGGVPTRKSADTAADDSTEPGESPSA